MIEGINGFTGLCMSNTHMHSHTIFVWMWAWTARSECWTFISQTPDFVVASNEQSAVFLLSYTWLSDAEQYNKKCKIAKELFLHDLYNW